ncbi:M56 family metallopeptidase [Amycolatopsis sp. H20-H5]|uniref:M56 family metallopeptidase n=1 Tax=Amycolatopsis sp. H20-H5 TaxID=3046309 RepID=UPI002DC04A26|nr:M56 family metallopeptidase [Amycolatopsis sp. H20-H5]MEC3976973.1 M56 family metallopeptidase [Amycolatopsis sp. H20-H5]
MGTATLTEAERPGEDGEQAVLVPSGTTLRFGTLVTVAIATTLYVFGRYASVLPVGTFTEDAQCQVHADLYLTSTTAVDLDETKWTVYRECMSRLFLPRLGWLIGGLLLLLLVSAAVYRATPGWRIRRSKLRPVEDYPALAQKLSGPLAELATKAGLRAAPRFLLDPASMRAGGVAFGRRKHMYVCLDIGLVALLDRDRESFDAIVLHELAHVRNGDVLTTYATLAVWRSFLFVVLLPYVLTVLDPPLLSTDPLRVPDFVANLGSSVTWSLFVRVALLVVLAYLARTAVLRSRERFADALVAQWTETSDPYQALTQRPRHRRVLRWITIHPSRAARVAAMEDPKSLLQPGFWEVLTNGLVIQLAWSHLSQGLADISWFREGNNSFLILRVLWSVAVGVVVCVIAWRGSAYLRAGGTGRSVFTLPGLALGLGLVLGRYLDVQQAGQLRPQLTLLTIAVSALFVAVAVLVCWWAGYCWGLLRDRVRSWRAVPVAAAVVVVCLSCLGWWRDSLVADVIWQDQIRPAVDLLHGYARTSGWTWLDPAVLDAFVVPFLLNFDRGLTALALALLWVVPLALMPGAGRRIRLALVSGLLGTAVWVVLAVGLRMLAGDRSTAAFALVLTSWELATAVLVQAVVTFFVARRDNWFAGLLASWVIGVLACAGIWLLHLSGGLTDSVPAARPQQVLPFAGTVAALIGGAAALIVRRRTKPVHTALSGQWLLIGVVVVISLAVQALSPPAPQSAPLLPPPATTAVVDENEAVTIWTYGGGWDRFTAVVTANNGVYTAFKTEDLAQVLTACEKLAEHVGAASAFPPPPSVTGRKSWPAAMTALTTGTSKCVRLYRDQEGDVTAMFTDLREGLTQLQTTLTLLNTARAQYTG